uniref:Uncharacterized protein n=1 Tax=Magnetococcus massalia (strain MO-1) TaxID=451514 RepID=A0A1S7LNL2_MAGMO|nr:protein of unknown function [Candidatus Magnetococcus massalia]
MLKICPVQTNPFLGNYCPSVWYFIPGFEILHTVEMKKAAPDRAAFVHALPVSRILSMSLG